MIINFLVIGFFFPSMICMNRNQILRLSIKGPQTRDKTGDEIKKVRMKNSTHKEKGDQIAFLT